MSDVPERFSRIERLIGAAGFNRLRRSFVVVVGLGAVGSYATEALARAGVGKLKLVDFDEIRSSNINRQLYAMMSTVGKAKIDVARQRVSDINPDCEIETERLFVDAETAGAVIQGGPDIVIDAIDALGPKVELLKVLDAAGISVVSCMGAALRTDATCVRVGELSKVYNCHLARYVRKKLRRDEIKTDFTCVYSIEPMHGLMEKAVASQSEADFFSRGRTRRTLGSLPTITGIFGLTAANTAIKMLLAQEQQDKPFESEGPKNCAQAG